MSATRMGGVNATAAHYARFSASLVSGVIGSMVGAIAMLLVMIVAFVAFAHTSAFYPLQIFGSYLFGDAALRSPTLLVLLGGLTFHLGTAAAWGIGFGFTAAVLRVDRSVGGSILLGLVVGLTAQLVEVNLITPALMRPWGHDVWAANVPPLLSWVSHVVFGLGFAVTPFLFRDLWLRWSGRADLTVDDPRIR